MRLSSSGVFVRLGLGAKALVVGATVSLACSGGEFTSAEGGTGGGSGSGGSSAGSGGSSSGSGGSSAGSGGAAGAGGSAVGGASGSGGRSGSAGTAGSSGSSGAGGGGRGGRGGSAGSGSGGTAGTSTGGTGGSAGRGGSGATGGSAGGGGNDGGISCRWGDMGACPNGQFCNALGCNSGTCMPLPAEGSTRNPVCGCDGISYWNAAVAAHRGMSVKTTGECSPARTCGGIAGLACPDPAALCNTKVPNATGCLVSDLGGDCWILPSVCPSGPGIGPNTRACGADMCKAECELIKAGEPWYVDGSCPQ